MKWIFLLFEIQEHKETNSFQQFVTEIQIEESSETQKSVPEYNLALRGQKWPKLLQFIF